MARQVLIHRKARDFYDRLPAKIQNKVKTALQELEKDPLTPRPKADIKKLSGTKGRKHAYRIRTGDYRIVYDVEDKTVYVTLIFPRGKEYQEL
ncbi:MAG: type II toxin-antitoxin system RelE/ParE family toxin [Candidatus Altiarchaeota archaeon]|nr:type II toxin-antitoxin system RelE/ParE family toxin [Candidatus Altiarchaeota archaeon]